jgi:hypothetical protein
LNRITTEIRYIVKKISDVFGQDIPQRMLFMLTHGKSDVQNAIDGIIDEQSFGEFKDYFMQDTSEKFMVFDNSCYFKPPNLNP